MNMSGAYNSMKMMYQIGLLFGVCLLGQAISAFLPIPFPGTVLSMIILFILLFFQVVKVDHIKQKADFLLKNMSFFFIPAGIGILSSFDLIRSSILPLLTVVVLTTILTFGATALTVQGVISLQDRLAHGRPGTPAVPGTPTDPGTPTVPGAPADSGKSVGTAKTDDPGNTDFPEGGETNE